MRQLCRGEIQWENNSTCLLKKKQEQTRDDIAIVASGYLGANMQIASVLCPYRFADDFTGQNIISQYIQRPV